MPAITATRDLVATESVEPPGERVANRARTIGLTVVVAVYLAAMAMLAKIAYSTPHSEAIVNSRPIPPNPTPVEAIRGHDIVGYRNGYLTDAIVSQGVFITVLAVIALAFVLVWTWRGSEARRAAAQTAS